MSDTAESLKYVHFKIRMINGTRAELLLAATDAGPSCFAVSVNKAGSTLFYMLVQEICTAAGRPCFNVMDQLFAQGVFIEDCPAEATRIFERKGLVFTGFRQSWLLDYVQQYRTATKLLLVRDPRDIAVSMYFSMRHSHPLPESGKVRDGLLATRNFASGITASDFVLQGGAEYAFANLDAFMHQTRRFGGFTCFRYEDVIWSKREWCAQIAQHLNIVLAPEILNGIADRHDVRPAEETPEKHIRQVAPGNHKKHLDERALRYIETRCKLAMDCFNYKVP